MIFIKQIFNHTLFPFRQSLRFLSIQKISTLTSIFLITAVNALGGNLEKGFERLKIYDYFKAKYYFEKCLKTQTSGAAYGLSIIFSLNNNPFYNLDSARIYILLADSTYNSAKPKTITSYRELAINTNTINAQKDSICERALKATGTFSSLDKYNEYIKKFSFCKQVSNAIELRNAAAFENARNTNTAVAYKNFMIQYPEAKELNDARNRYEERLYEESTQDKKITSYENFIIQNPASPYRLQAENAIYALTVTQKTIAQYDAFIKKYPGNRNTNDAWRELYNLKMKDYNESNYEKFKATYPNYPFKSELESDYRLQTSFLLPFKKDSLWGFINEEGKEMIKPVYDEVSLFSESLSAVSKNGKFGYINKNGAVTIPFIFDDAEPFKKNIAVVSKKEKYGLIDRNGNELIPIIYDELSEPSEAVCMAAIEEKSGYVSLNGKKLTEFIFDFAGDFKDGFAIVATGEKYGLINNNGGFSIEPRYDGLFYFSQAQLIAELNGKKGLINFAGELVLPFEYEGIGDLISNRALVVKNNKCGFIDAKGKIVIAINYPVNENIKNAAQFDNGYIVLQQKNKLLVLDSAGNKFFIPGYDGNSMPAEDLIAVKKNKKWGYADKNGKLKIAIKYDLAGEFKNGYAIVKTTKGTGVIDRNGKIIIEPVYTSITSTSNFFVVNANGNTGLMNQDGIKILDANYDKIEFLSAKIAAALQGNGLLYFSLETGRVIWSSLK